ncbi:Uncharacterised protein [Mycobacterium tuberculosis]|uniref:Uncharacterized protein n=1 Tax=Mycobacterium tuberculosis TaxID=1773 RepID=A0A654TT61_MYCTX|nr:Uncharacterised protein [Mycobacterium tuberculosis]CNM18954.1 Uncharacterised protein [Mycobacterium tuberculosis]CNM29061.1 Uncharacterised protein [Mycobacterium tuberculosis]CNM43060.1 Uncharacterised protein [Mycobacterium tuberculosis]CNM53750.1 Uncharacterised protein [Mycobacterium tuberculosis]
MFPGAAELNDSWISSRVRMTLRRSPSGSLTSHPTCGCRRMRPPLAPPRLSLPRNDDAAAHAVETSCETVNPDARIWLLRLAISASPTRSWLTAGTGSCHSRVCLGTSGPRYLATGPMSRWISLYQALANSSANSSGCSSQRRVIRS